MTVAGPGDGPRVVAWRPGLAVTLRPGVPVVALADVRSGARFDPATFPAHEHERAARFVRDDSRDEYLAARGIVRTVVAEMLGVTPADVPFEAEPNQKPRVVTAAVPGFDVSVSHAGGRVACAFLHGGTVGVDVELRGRHPRDVDALARRVLSSAEVEALQHAPDPVGVFLRAWTRKEAVLKASGHGLALPTTAFDVLRWTGDRVADVSPVRADGRLWTCVSPACTPDIELACAYATA